MCRGLSAAKGCSGSPDASGGAGRYLDVLQQVLHVCHGEAVEEGVRLVHLHGQVIVLGADVLGQQVDGLSPPVPDADLGAAREQGSCV